MHRLTTNSIISVNTIEKCVSQNYNKSACRKPFSNRRYATHKSNQSILNHEATNIAVIGGGITGLASAYYLSKSLPNARITLIEGSSRLGGWLHSKQVDVGSGNVVFEQGPRNLRPSVPNGLVTLNLV